MVESVEAGPSLRAAPFGPGIKEVIRLLSARQRSQIASIATCVNAPARTVVCREGASAQSVFIITAGVVKMFRDLPSGKRRVLGFLFADDVFGLAQNGHYDNTVQTITPVTLYRMRVSTLADTLRRDADLTLQFVCKLTHELRRALRHNVIIARRDAVGRVTMFLGVLEQNGLLDDSRIEIPMSRSDVANYLGLSLESVSRALGRLERNRIIAYEGRHGIRIVDRTRFDKILAAL
jgi:CRP-like cAMP-binding protein